MTDDIERIARRTPLQRRTLHAMRKRWENDLSRLEAAYGEFPPEECGPESETPRNLATAIAWINDLITAHRRGDE